MNDKSNIAATSGGSQARWCKIPAELQQRPQWTLAGPDKSPLTIHGTRASTTDPTTWSSFDAVCDAATKHGLHIGYVISKDDPFACIDLDVKDYTTPEQMQRFQLIVNSLNSYSEYSRSGKGMHVWVRGAIGTGCKRDGVEVYSQERFIVCTGNPYIDRPIEDRTQLVNMLVTEIRKALGSLGDKPKIADSPQVEADSVVVDRAHRAQNGAKFDALWRDESAGYGSISEADLALMSMIAFYSPNNEQCKRIFRDSVRGKRAKITKHKTYLDRTLHRVRANDKRAEALEHGRQIAANLIAKFTSKEDEWIVRIDDIHTNPSLPHEFLTQLLLPAKQVTLLSADGGKGKTILALTWAAHAAVGEEFLDKKVTKAPVVFYSAEDDGERLRDVLRLICEHFDLNLTDVAKNLTIVDATEINSVLFEEGANGALRTTDAYDRLKRLVLRKEARYVFIDNASEVFEANEVARKDTKAFIRSLRALIRPTRGAVLLLAHVNAETAKGASNAKDYSGNTAWHNSVRSRLFFGDKADDDPSLLLIHRKSNYGKKAAPMDLAMTENGLLEVITSVEAQEARTSRDALLGTQLVQFIRELTAQGISVPMATTGSKTLFKVLSKHPQFPKSMNTKICNKLVEAAYENKLLKADAYKTDQRKDGWRYVPV
jgi:hypothetical protein